MKWIKISEQLPKYLQDVLISDGQEVCYGGYVAHENEKAYWSRLCSEYCGVEPIYWMPLPTFFDPLKEDEKCQCGCEDDGEKPTSPKEIKEFIKSISGVNEELISEDYREEYKKERSKGK